MHNKPLHQMQVVKREEKEALLFKFILEEIADGRVALNSDWRVVALSMQSPVIGAMRRAQLIAVAMDSRAFGASKSRTFIQDIQMQAADWLFVGATTLYVALAASAGWVLG